MSEGPESRHPVRGVLSHLPDALLTSCYAESPLPRPASGLLFQAFVKGLGSALGTVRRLVAVRMVFSGIYSLWTYRLVSGI